MTELLLISEIFSSWYQSYTHHQLNLKKYLDKIINLNFTYKKNIYSSEIIEKSSTSIINQNRLVKELNIKITHPFLEFRQLDEFNIKKLLIIDDNYWTILDKKEWYPLFSNIIYFLKIIHNSDTLDTINIRVWYTYDEKQVIIESFTENMIIKIIFIHGVKEYNNNDDFDII